MTEPALASLVLSVEVDKPCTVSVDLGRAAQAAFLGLVQVATPELAARLHQGEGLKPYTVSGLHGVGRSAHGQVALTPGRGYWLRFTSCDGELSGLLWQWAASPPRVLWLDPVPLRVLGAAVRPEAHPWAGQATWEGLVAAGMDAERPSTSLRYEFLSPTAFAAHGRDRLFPEPDLLFDGLARRWDAFSPLKLGADVGRVAAEAWVVSRYELSTRIVEYGPERRIGFVGECQYSAAGAEPLALRASLVLAAFALYSGVGRRTGAGMGQVRAQAQG